MRVFPSFCLSAIKFPLVSFLFYMLFFFVCSKFSKFCFKFVSKCSNFVLLVSFLFFLFLLLEYWHTNTNLWNKFMVSSVNFQKWEGEGAKCTWVVGILLSLPFSYENSKKAIFQRSRGTPPPPVYAPAFGTCILSPCIARVNKLVFV